MDYSKWEWRGLEPKKQPKINYRHIEKIGIGLMIFSSTTNPTGEEVVLSYIKWGVFFVGWMCYFLAEMIADIFR